MQSASASAFLNSLGVVIHVDQGYDPASYLDPLRYTGIRQARVGPRNITSNIMLHQQTGVRFAVNGGSLTDLLSAAKALAGADALLALEGPNEPNNFPIEYDGKRGGGPGGSWLAIADYQKALYAAVKSDSTLHRYPVFGPSETGAETDNVGLQFLSIPLDNDTLLPKGTRFADYANVHNYVSGNGGQYNDNQAWNAADPTLSARWDGLFANHGVTWHKHFKGYSNQQLLTLPRVTTETGWDSKENAGGPDTQGKILVNTYLAQFKRGWAYTFIYEMRDGEGGGGNQGLYDATKPKPAATYIHNLTTILSDNTTNHKAGSLAYSVANPPSGIHDLLLQKSNGLFELTVWGEKVSGSDLVTINLSKVWQMVKVYDVTTGTAPVQALSRVSSVRLTISDHAMIVEISD